jgi:hypothetical protein
MNFRTEIIPLHPGDFLRPGDGVCWMGSCFSEHMAARLLQHRFRVSGPSHGILFHPLPLARSLSDVLDEKIPGRDSFVYHRGRYHCLSHHGSFSSEDPDELFGRIGHRQQEFAGALETSRMLLLTLGTSWAWRYSGDESVAGNCHKLPGDLFRRELISFEQSREALADAIGKLLSRYPRLRVVISVSPVRHWREGYAGNQLSKAHLILAAHELSAAFPNVLYFPAYELFMDDLRDYRYYASDMIHPSEQGVQYVWEKFTEWSMNDGTRDIINRIGKLSRIFDHVPGPEGAEHLKALSEAEKRIQELIAAGRRTSP